MGASRQDLRRRIGELIGDVEILTATASGSTTTFVDALNLAHSKGSLRARYGFFAAGTANNLYSTVRVTDNDPTTTTLTFTPAVSASTAASDVLELYSRDGQGVRPEQIHRVINSCIESVKRAVLTEVVDSNVTFDADSPTLAIEATWRRLSAVEWLDPNLTDDDWNPVPEADLVVDRVGYTVRVDGPSRYLLDTATTRLRGFTAAAALSADTDTTAVDAEWLVYEAASQLLLSLATAERVPDRRAADYRATSQYLAAKANALRPKVPTSLRGASGWVLGT